MTKSEMMYRKASAINGCICGTEMPQHLLESECNAKDHEVTMLLGCPDCDVISVFTYTYGEEKP